MSTISGEVQTFTKTVDMGGASYSGLLSTNAYAHYQYLYLASNINGSGMITGLAIKYNSAVATAVTCPNATINLSHSNLANLTNTFASNLGTGQGGQTTVLNNATMTFPAGAAGSWQTISLATPFNYNGKDNLIVDVVLTSACSGTVPDNVNTGWPYTAVNFTFTNGSATGLTDTWAANGRLVFAGGDDAVIPAAGAAINSGTPFTNTPGACRKMQIVYPASEINGTGPITGIGFPVGGATTAQDYTVSVKFGHSTLTSFTAPGTFSANFNVGAPVTMANAISFKVPAGIPTAGYLWIPVPDGAFSYNGTDSLIVEVDVSASAGVTTWMARNTGIDRMTCGLSGSNSALVAQSWSFNIKLRFNGGTMDVMANEVTDSSQVLGGMAPGGQIQSLYSSAELGTGGTITSVSVRLRDDSVATALTNYKLYIGNTAKTIYNIADSYASNMDENALVFSGTLNVPAGLKAGDWVTIPLSTSFTYNPTKNLSVLFTTDVGSDGNNRVRLGYSATQYPIRSVGRNDNAGTTPSWTYDGITEVRFGISK